MPHTIVRRVLTHPAPAAVALGLVLGAMVVKMPGIIAVLAPATLGGLLLVALVGKLTDWPGDLQARHRVLWWTAASFAAHLLLGLVITSSSGLIGFFGPDALTYHDGSLYIVRHWAGGVAPTFGAGKEGFYYVLAGLYWALGAHMLAGVALNATFAAALVPVVTDTTRRLFGQAAARYATPLVVVFPGLLLWTSQVLKEAVIVLLVAVAANCAVRLIDRTSIGAMGVLAVTLALLFTFRGPVAFVLAATLVAGVAFGIRALASGLAVGMAILAVIGVTLAAGLGSSGYQVAVDADLARAQELREALAREGTSGFQSDVDISTPKGALRFLPAGVTNFAFGPFPWQIRAARHLAAVPDVVAWWFLLPSLWRGQRAGRQHGRRQLVLILPALGLCLLLALSIGNFGTVVRERIQIVVLVAPIIALGLSRRLGQGAPEQPGVLQYRA